MCSFLLFAGNFRDLSAKFAIAIYHRQGTETSASGVSSAIRLYCNLSPQGDGNAEMVITSGFSPLYCNLSPQGDGNCFVLYAIEFFAVLQFIPARGRKLIVGTIAIDGEIIAIYPRKGTETPACGRDCKKVWKLQFIPARGRKPSASSAAHPGCHCNLSPQGDGNNDPSYCRDYRLIVTYPRKGTETPAFASDFMFMVL